MKIWRDVFQDIIIKCVVRLKIWLDVSLLLSQSNDSRSGDMMRICQSPSPVDALEQSEENVCIDIRYFA